MMRTVSIPSRSNKTVVVDDEDYGIPADVEDDAVVELAGFPETLTVHQHIVYSPTFQVPTFYFVIHHKGMYQRFQPSDLHLDNSFFRWISVALE